MVTDDAEEEAERMRAYFAATRPLPPGSGYRALAKAGGLVALDIARKELADVWRRYIRLAELARQAADMLENANHDDAVRSLVDDLRREAAE